MSVHHALRATSIASALGFVLALLSAVVLARLLTPEEIGIFSIAVSLVSFSHALRDFGVAQYLVQLKTLERSHLQASFTVMAMMSWSMAVLLIVLSGPASVFYKQPGVGKVFWVLSGSFVVLPFGSYILSVLKRDMRFDQVAVVNTVTSVVQTVATLGLAWGGTGYLSMAWGALIGNLTTIGLLYAYRPSLALIGFTRLHLRELFKFGSQSSLSTLMAQIGSSGPDLILGKTLSAEAVAHYSRAASPLNMIVGKVNEVLGQVFTPAFAQGLRDGQTAQTLLSRSITLCTGVNLPMVAVVALLSQPLILVLFGPQWTQAAMLAPWLTLYWLISSPVTFASSALVAGGHVRAMLIGSWITNLILLAVLLLSVWWPLAVVVHGLALHRLITLWTWQRLLRRCYGYRASSMWQATRPSLVLMCAIVIPTAAVRWGLPALAPAFGSLTLLTTCGIVATAASVLALLMIPHPLRAELPRLAPPLRHLFGSDPLWRKKGKRGARNK